MLYDYQQHFVNDIFTALKTNKKVLAQLPTGAGKTFCFCHITKVASEANKRVLILVHRDELVEQTVKSLIKLGVPSESITSKKRKLLNHSNCFVAMEKTIFNRLQKNKNFLTDIDLIIADEVHIQVFNKVIDLFSYAKVIGFTATPTVLKRDTFFRCEICQTEYKEVQNCCGGEVLEWSRPYSLSNIYDTIVCGIGIDELIKRDKLVQEISLVKKTVDTSDLKVDKKGEFTEKSQTKVFTDEKSIKSLVDDYKEFCLGKKVMIFTGSTKVNKTLEQAFSNYNAKIFDTINSDENRKEVVNWFKEEKDAILISTGIFTAGFDVKDVEVIMMYRSTKSLALYIQIVGRGARTYPGKFNFLFIDYGYNIQEHGEFSDPTRNWEQIFYKGIGKERPKREALEAVTQCDGCGILYPSSMSACPSCGETPKPKKKKVQKGEEYVLEPLRPMPSPSGSKIIEYAKYMGKDVNFAFKVLSRQVVDLFRFYQIDQELYNTAKNSGELDTKIDRMIQKAYFVIIRSGLTGKNRRLKTVIEAIKLKIEKYYEDV